MSQGRTGDLVMNDGKRLAHEILVALLDRGFSDNGSNSEVNEPS